MLLNLFTSNRPLPPIEQQIFSKFTLPLLNNIENISILDDVNLIVYVQDKLLEYITCFYLSHLSEFHDKEFNDEVLESFFAYLRNLRSKAQNYFNRIDSDDFSIIRDSQYPTYLKNTISKQTQKQITIDFKQKIEVEKIKKYILLIFKSVVNDDNLFNTFLENLIEIDAKYISQNKSGLCKITDFQKLENISNSKSDWADKLSKMISDYSILNQDDLDYCTSLITPKTFKVLKKLHTLFLNKLRILYDFNSTANCQIIPKFDQISQDEENIYTPLDAHHKYVSDVQDDERDKEIASIETLLLGIQQIFNDYSIRAKNDSLIYLIKKHWYIIILVLGFAFAANNVLSHLNNHHLANAIHIETKNLDVSDQTMVVSRDISSRILKLFNAPTSNSSFSLDSQNDRYGSMLNENRNPVFHQHVLTISFASHEYTTSELQKLNLKIPQTLKSVNVVITGHTATTKNGNVIITIIFSNTL